MGMKREEGIMIEETSVDINSPDHVIALKSAIVCTNIHDDYSRGFRNGVRYAIYILMGEKPEYE